MSPRARRCSHQESRAGSARSPLRAASDSQAPAALADREILHLVARGLSKAEIAGRLVISPLTAKTHVINILRKLDRRDRAALVALAYEMWLITPGEAY